MTVSGAQLIRSQNPDISYTLFKNKPLVSVPEIEL